MTEHIPAEALRDYVMGSLEAEYRARLEAHAVECEGCSQRLRQEAQLELAMYAVAREAERPDRCPACLRPTADDRCGYCGAARRAGNYRTRAVISQTPKGRVYLAEGPDGQRIALKELIFTQIPDLKSIESFEREGRVLRQLSHPQIPQYIDSFTDGDGVNMRFYLAQTYVEGQSLADRLLSHRYQESEVRTIAERVLEVLVYLQALSPPVIHRDLKPSNLLQREDGSIVLVDFGSARERGHTVQGTFAGTFGFAPPEQLVGIVDGTSDLYALGMTILHLLTRSYPSGLDHGPEFEKAAISTPFRRWLSKMTASAPKLRYASAAEALRALRHPARSRPPTLIWALAATATVGAAWALLGSDPSPPVAPRNRPPVAASVALPERPPPPSPALPDPRGRLMVQAQGAPLPELGLNVDNRWVDPSALPVRLPAGSHTLIAVWRKGLCTTTSTSIAVEAARTTTVTVRCVSAHAAPRPPDVAPVAEPSAPPSPTLDDPATGRCRPTEGAAPGYLTLATRPPAEVFFEGRSLGETPLARVKLPAGCLEIVAKAEGRQKVVKLLVHSNVTTRYSFEF
ncbi:MAG: protein kinase [Myxococcota bacterium]